MKVKMLLTTRGTLNNGLGNITIEYLAGNVYDACDEEALLWIKQGIAIPVNEPVAKNVTVPKSNTTVKLNDTIRNIIKPKRRK